MEHEILIDALLTITITVAVVGFCSLSDRNIVLIKRLDIWAFFVACIALMVVCYHGITDTIYTHKLQQSVDAQMRAFKSMVETHNPYEEEE
jgi:hypothetical protein